MAIIFSDGRSRREPPTMGKQLVNFITCGCEPSTSFFVIYKAGAYRRHLLCNQIRRDDNMAVNNKS
jgi:hypothetical protein